jgi:hypothetical protein
MGGYTCDQEDEAENPEFKASQGYVANTIKKERKSKRERVK